MSNATTPHLTVSSEGRDGPPGRPGFVGVIATCPVTPPITGFNTRISTRSPFKQPGIPVHRSGSQL